MFLGYTHTVKLKSWILKSGVAWKLGDHATGRLRMHVILLLSKLKFSSCQVQLWSGMCQCALLCQAIPIATNDLGKQLRLLKNFGQFWRNWRISAENFKEIFNFSHQLSGIEFFHRLVEFLKSIFRPQFFMSTFWPRIFSPIRPIFFIYFSTYIFLPNFLI